MEVLSKRRRFDFRPRHNGRVGRARAVIAAAIVSLPLLAGCTSGQPSGRTLECPSAPFTSRVTSGDLERDALRGPARGDVSGGVFVHRLSLDGGALTVRPPRSHDHAGYAGGAALCEVMASTTVNGFTIGPQSPDTIAAGLARVTVDPTLPSMSMQLFGVQPSKRPVPARYQDRLAWVVVVSPPIRINGGSGGLTCPLPTKRERATRHNYVVFAVDAQTGGDALLYTEGNYGQICAGAHESPHVDVPLTSVSVPWRLVSERPDRARARIAFDVAPCDGYDRDVLAERDTYPARIRVVVSRPFGPLCGPTRRVVVSARPAAIGLNFSPTLAHAPVGPYINPA